MVVQDDARESELIRLFDLVSGEERSGIDAYLALEGERVPLELKSTTKGSVTTARDVSSEHLERWKNRHWLIGFYNEEEQLQYCHYGSPRAMLPWITSVEEKIGPDLILSKLAPDLITTDVLIAIAGDKEKYELDDGKKITKRQKGHGCVKYTKSTYLAQMDLENGYSKARMLKILKDRCHYLISRGSTLNNPHIPENYFDGWKKIDPGDSAKLKILVAEAIGTRD